MKTTILIILITLVLSCKADNPLEKKFNVDTMENDLKNIDPNTAEELANSIYVLSFNGVDINGMTYGQMLEKAKEFDSEGNSKLDVTVVDWKLDVNGDLNIDFKITNGLPRHVEKLEGNIAIMDQYLEEIASLYINDSSETIKPGESFISESIVPMAQIPVNQAAAIKENIDNLQFVWIPK